MQVLKPLADGIARVSNEVLCLFYLVLATESIEILFERNPALPGLQVWSKTGRGLDLAGLLSTCTFRVVCCAVKAT